MRQIFSIGVLILSLFITSSALAEPGIYVIDQNHTTVEFKIRHVFSWVKGTFNEFEGSFVYDPENPSVWKTEATIQAASIDTRVAPRDKHLRSNDFFDVETYPILTFKSTKVTDVVDGTAKLHGLLNLHGVEKEIVLDLEIHGVGPDAWGNTLAGFTATGEINRKDFGLNWNQVLETGQVLVGEEVKITLEVEGMLQE